MKLLIILLAFLTMSAARLHQPTANCEERISHYLSQICTIGQENCPPSIDKNTEDICGPKFVSTMVSACCSTRKYELVDTDQLVPKKSVRA